MTYLKNPTGFDGLTMENHHPGRQEGPTTLITKTEHDFIHQHEMDAVRDVFQADGLSGNPGNWSAGARKPFGK